MIDHASSFWTKAAAANFFRHRVMLSVVAATGLLLIRAPRAGAQQPGRDLVSDTPPTASYEYYRTSTLVADGIGLAAGIASYELDDRSGAFANLLGFATSLVGPPIIHLLHKNAPAAGKSLLLRLGLPFVAGVLVASRSHCDEGLCKFGTFFAGAKLGFAIAAVIDAGWLAKRERPRRPPPLIPTVGATRGGATLGLAAVW